MQLNKIFPNLMIFTMLKMNRYSAPVIMVLILGISSSSRGQVTDIKPVTPNASEEAVQLLKYIDSI